MRFLSRAFVNSSAWKMRPDGGAGLIGHSWRRTLEIHIYGLTPGEVLEAGWWMVTWSIVLVAMRSCARVAIVRVCQAWPPPAPPPPQKVALVCGGGTEQLCRLDCCPSRRKWLVSPVRRPTPCGHFEIGFCSIYVTQTVRLATLTKVHRWIRVQSFSKTLRESRPRSKPVVHKLFFCFG